MSAMSLLQLFMRKMPQKKREEEAAAIQDVQSYIAIEQTSGKILMQNNQDEVRGIASMSKMISQYLILEAIKKEKSLGKQNPN